MRQPDNTIKLSPREKLAVGRFLAREAMPYFRAALYALVPREAPGLGTIGVTEQLVLLWDPAAIEEWPLEQVAGALVHEVSHVLRDHAGRCRAGNLDHALYNVAADCAINDDLVKTALKLPEGKTKSGEQYGPCVPSKFGMPDGRTEEEYYHLLRQHAETCPQCKASMAGGGDSESEGGDGEGGDGKKKGRRGKGRGHAHGPGQPQAGGGWCGSGGGRKVPGEPEDGQPDPDGRAGPEVDRVRRQVASDVKEAASKNRGSVPGNWERWADEVVRPPKVRWQDKLARAARASVAYKAGAADYTRRRPSRRQSSMETFFGRKAPRLTGLHSPVPRVAFWLDTSGSMGTAELTAAIQEARGALLAVGCDIDFLSVDAAVQRVRKVRHWRELLSSLRGGGGTDFRAPFIAMEEGKVPRPDCIIYATDGIGPAPSAPPQGVKVIWLLVGPGRQRPWSGDDSAQQITWGDFIEVEGEGRP